jgi:hypothetical protein
MWRGDNQQQDMKTHTHQRSPPHWTQRHHTGDTSLRLFARAVGALAAEADAGRGRHMSPPPGARLLMAGSVKLVIVAGGDHRLSEPEHLRLLVEAVGEAAGVESAATVAG